MRTRVTRSFENAFGVFTCRSLKRGFFFGHRVVEMGRAQAFLGAHRSARPWVTWTVAGEFAEGSGGVREPACAALLERFDVLEMNMEVADRHARVAQYLRRDGRLTGANDLWIAAAARAHTLPVVTDNAAHFERVPDLQVLRY